MILIAKFTGILCERISSDIKYKSETDYKMTSPISRVPFKKIYILKLNFLDVLNLILLFNWEKSDVSKFSEAVQMALNIETTFNSTDFEEIDVINSNDKSDFCNEYIGKILWKTSDNVPFSRKLLMLFQYVNIILYYN